MLNASTKVRNLLLAATAGGLTLASTVAQAVVLWPGGTVWISGTTYAADPKLGGTVIQDTLRPFSMKIGATVYDGVLQDRVVRETKTGTLDFYYRIWLDKQWLQAQNMILERANYPMTPSGGGFSTDVNWRIDGLGSSAPDEAARSSDGKIVAFDFPGLELGPGSAYSTRFVFISTNAKTYNGAGFIKFQISGGTVVSLPAWQPS